MKVAIAEDRLPTEIIFRMIFKKLLNGGSEETGALPGLIFI